MFLFLLDAQQVNADVYAERLFDQHCAVCHGADRGGYIGPALHRETLNLTPALVEAKIRTGGFGTLMPKHPVWWSGVLSREEVAALTELVTTQPLRKARWTLQDAADSLEILVANEDLLPARPVYAIDSLDDLMAVMARGRYAAGAEAKVVFLDGRTHRIVGEVPTGYAPHLLDFHPVADRWAYVRNDVGEVLKIDLYSMRIVRRIRAGLNGASLAISRDGHFIAAGSFVPHTVVILDADSLEPRMLLELTGRDPDGRLVEADAGAIMATPLADAFVVVLEQAGQVWIIDLTTPQMPVTRITDVGRHLHDAFASPDGRHLFVASYDDDVIAVIDLVGRRVVKRIPAGCKPHLGSGAMIERHGRSLGIGTNIGVRACQPPSVTVFDMRTLEPVKQIQVLGPTESPAAHPHAPYIAVDIVGIGPDSSRIQLIDKNTLEVARTIDVGGHSHFPEYTARGDFLYVSAGYRGDRVVIYDAADFKRVKTVKIEAPAGIFSHLRARAPLPGSQQGPAHR